MSRYFPPQAFTLQQGQFVPGKAYEPYETGRYFIPRSRLTVEAWQPAGLREFDQTAMVITLTHPDTQHMRVYAGSAVQAYLAYGEGGKNPEQIAIISGGDVALEGRGPILAGTVSDHSLHQLLHAAGIGHGQCAPSRTPVNVDLLGAVHQIEQELSRR